MSNPDMPGFSAELGSTPAVESTGPALLSPGTIESTSAELARINQELSRLLDRAPAPLVAGADSAQRDPLVICGLLGGKDVGKSTLINALAGQEISVDRDEVGAGTSRPLVYVHRDMIGQARSRLGEICRMGSAENSAASAELQFFPHQADSIRNVVLVDLPDFDSDFREHEAVARAVAPCLDRVIWVVTPRKIADRAWVAFAREVVKASTNIYFVLNKSDELMADEEGWVGQHSAGQVEQQADQFARQQRRWACSVLEQTGYDVQEDRLFLVAARYPQATVFIQRVAAIWDDPHWSRYQDDRDVVSAIGQRFSHDLDRLRETVLAPIDPETAAQIKHENLRAQIRQNVQRVCEHFELNHWIAQVRRVVDPDYRQTLLNAAFGQDVCRVVASRLLRSRRSDAELADEIMDGRAVRWPVLRVVYWLSRWAIRRVGRAVAGTGPADASRLAGPPEELFRVRARSLADRVSLITDRLKLEHGPLLAQLRLNERLPQSPELAAAIESDLAELPLRGDEETVERLVREYRPSRIGRLLVWLVLLWFPFAQPIAEGMLEMSAAGTHLTDWLHGLYRVVLALGAVQLLHGLVVVALIYVAMLAAIYGRCVRDVQAARFQLAGSTPASRSKKATARPGIQEQIENLAQEVDSMLLTGVIGPILRPFELADAQLAQINERLAVLGRS